MPSIGPGQEDDGEQGERRAARADLRSRNGSDETRAAGEIGGDPAVHGRGEQRRGRCDGR